MSFPEVADELRRAGLRATGSRIGILQALRRATAPVSHNDMFAVLRGRRWDRTTIYRNLLELSRVGLARRFDLGDHTWRFEATGAAEAHPHFVCNSCGEIECLADVELAVRSERAPRALRARDVEIQVRGVCDGCR